MEQLVETIVQKMLAAGLIEVEVSARHVHLTKQRMELLFGKDAQLHPDRYLSQPGQFLAKERVTLYGSKGMLEHVAVLGPLRTYDQVELSKSDCATLGLKGIPIRESGRLEQSGSIVIAGAAGQIQLAGGVITAHRHIHAPKHIAGKLGLRDGDRVRVRMITERPVVFEDVIVRVGEQSGWRMHIDFDEANAAAASGFTLGQILLFVKKEGEEDRKPEAAD